MKAINLKILFLIVSLFLLTFCKKEVYYENTELSNNPSTNNELTQTTNYQNKDTILTNTKQKILLSPKQLSVLFPNSILNFKRMKINEGKFNYLGIYFNTASAEYVSRGSSLTIYVYDYGSLDFVPDYLKSQIFESPVSKAFDGGNGHWLFDTDPLSPSQICNILYLDRFYVKIEGYNISDFNATISDIISNLNFPSLKKIVR